MRSSAFALVLGAALAPLTAQTRPNVLIFFTDDQGTLDAGCYGSNDLSTPAIDALAAQGVRFTQAYAHTVCCPSRALLLTGRHPQRSGVNSWTQGNMLAKRGVNMFLDELTLAEKLKQHGYRTGLVGKWHLGAAPTHGPRRQGFDSFFGFRGGFIDNRNHHFLHGKGFHDLYRGTKKLARRGEYFPAMVVAEAEKFLAAKSDQPFFLYVALNLPHYPEQPSAANAKRFDKLPMPRRSYARVVATADDQIGKVLAALDASGQRDNTVIAFASDNGHSTEQIRIRHDNHLSGLPKGHDYGALGGGGNAGKWRGHKGTFFEGGIRVPAILSYPRRLPKSAVRHQAVSIADFYPTILELCGLPLPKRKLDGKSLLQVCASPDAPSPHRTMHWQWMDSWAIRRGPWKLIRRGKRVTLANLEEAEPERKNHAADQPALLAELTKLHQAWASEVMPAPRQAPVRGMLRLARVEPRHVEPWPALDGEGYRAWRSDRALVLTFARDLPKQIVLPRLGHPILRAHMVGQRRAKVPVHPEPDRWILKTNDVPTGPRPIVVVHFSDWPVLHRRAPVRADEAGHFVLPAHRATTVGKRLRYEPQPHKNTIGYWTNPADYATWQIIAPKAGRYAVEVLQGCGKGQGGSRVSVGTALANVEFDVQDTGHFQNFVRRSVGTIELAAGPHTIAARVLRMAKNAALDIREIRLVRQK